MFLLKPDSDFPTAYSTLVDLEKEKHDLIVTTKITPGYIFILNPKTIDTARYLHSTIFLTSNRTVDIDEVATRKIVLVGFPHEFPTEALLDLPNISAKKLLSRTTKLETCQILLSPSKAKTSPGETAPIFSEHYHQKEQLTAHWTRLENLRMESNLKQRIQALLTRPDTNLDSG